MRSPEPIDEALVGVPATTTVTRLETNAMDPIRDRPGMADSGAERPPRKVGIYDRARSSSMGGVAIAAIALVVLLIVLWLVFA